MTLRVARHTKEPERIKTFYLELLGLDLLGEFQGHDGYDGIFIGSKGLDWHLEFTVSDHLPSHTADEDDLLVFYAAKPEYDRILERMSDAGIPSVTPRNPYWEKKGKTFVDPDGFRVVIVPNKPSNS